MDDKAMQKWGVIVGGGAVAIALAAASIGGGPKPAVTTPISAKADIRTPPISAPGQTPDPTAIPVSSGAPDDAVVEPASGMEAPTGPPPSEAVSYVVRFRPDHPVGRAQLLAAQGDVQRAAAVARTALRSQSALSGLCFDRFTVGGAEIVLRPCTPVPAPQRAAFQRRWTQRFAQMSGVEYAEPNVTLMPEERG